MKGQEKTVADSLALRRKAEKLLEMKLVSGGLDYSEIEMARLYHELEVHQVELEIQNEELRLAMSNAQSVSEKYTELYDFAPSGYFTLTKEGEIIELNLSGATMLGKERIQLKNSMFGFFVSGDSRPIFNCFLEKIFNSRTKETCEVTLLENGDIPLYVFLTGTSDLDREECLVSAVDITERKLNEDLVIRRTEELEKRNDELKKSEEKFRHLTENATDVIWVLNLTLGKYTYVSPSIQRMSGFTPEEAVQQSIEESLTPESSQEVFELIPIRIKEFTEHPENGKVYYNQFAHPRKDGKVIWVEAATKLQYNSAGEIEVIGVSRDITERKKAEEAIQISEAKYHGLFDSSIDAILITSSDDGRIHAANGEACRMFGMTEEELLKGGREAIIDFSDTRIKLALDESERTGKFRGELSFKRKDGTIFPVDASKTVLTDNEGREKSVMILRDITERKKAEQALHQSEERYKSIFQNNHSILLLIHPDTGKITDANPAACEYYGWTHDELCAKNISDINTLSKEEVTAEMQKAKRENRRQFFFRHRLATNEIRDVEVISGPVQYGKTVLLYSIIHDITERKLAENALQKSEQLLKSVLNNVSSGVALIDETGQFAVVNPLFLKLFGIAEGSTLKNVNDQNWADWQVYNIDGDLLEVDDHPVRKAVLTGKRVEHQQVGVKLPSGGELIWMLISAEPIFKGNGDIDKIICTYHDITQLKVVEDALRASEQRLDAVFNGVTETIMMADIEGKILTANYTAAKRWGMTIEEITGYNAFEYVGPEKRRQRELIIREMIETRSPVRFEDDSKDRIYDLTFYPVIETSGEINKFVVFNRDITGQRLAEEEVAKSEKKLSEIYASMSEGLAVHELVFDPSGKAVDYVITEVNPAYENITGIKRDDVIGKSASILYSVAPAPYLDTYAQVESTGWPACFETYFPPMDKYFSISVSSPGKGIFVTVFRDITIQKYAEEAVKISESKFRNLVYNMEVGVLLNGPQSEILLANPKALDLLGLTEDQILGKTPFDPDWKAIHEDGSFFPGETHPAALAIATGKPVKNVVMGVYQPLIGDHVWFLINAQPQLDENGAVVQIVTTFVDITELKKAQNELKISEQRLKYHFENSPLGVVEWDNNFVMTQWSVEAERIFGWGKEDIIGKRIDELNLVYDDDIPIVANAMERLFNGEEVTVVNHNRNLTKSGSIIDCIWYNSILLDQNGQMASVMSLVQDVTQQKQAETALRESEYFFRESQRA
ncbi:MAG TPA: PAS domain S-box protein, partial [Prolixibacteraceae bacterium]